MKSDKNIRKNAFKMPLNEKKKLNSSSNGKN